VKSRELIQSILSILSSLFLVAPVFADVKIKVTPSRTKIYLGETFNLTVSVEGADRDVGMPDLSALTACEVKLLDQRSNSRSSIMIVNGRVTREVFEGREFAYAIKPAAEGVFHAGPVRVTVKGKTYTEPGVSVQVAGVEPQDTVIVAVSASSTSVLVEEPFTVALTIAVQELPEPYADSNEPIHPSQLPHLEADFLELRQTTPGLKGPDLNQILNALIDQSGRQPSFAINSYQTRDLGFGSLFDGADPFRPRPIRFRLAPERVTLNGKKYRQYKLSLDYTPVKEGEYTFGPVSFKGTVIGDVTADRQAVTKDVYTIGPAVTVRVVPPPDEGRPEWFVGTVGKGLAAAASFDATTCKVGDPLKLTLDITGQISVSNLRTPILNLQPELGRDFRIYDENATSDTLPNGKRFTYRVRPTREGTLEFPPIKISYYDTERRAYVTVETSPIPIQAKATTQIATSDDDGQTQLTGMIAMQKRPLPAGLSLSPAGARETSLLPPKDGAILVALAGPALTLLASLLAPLTRAVRAWRSRRRRTGARSRACSALRRTCDARDASLAVRTFLADRMQLAGTALTPQETHALLIRSGVPSPLADACRDQTRRLDELMYRPDANVTLEETLRALRALIPQLDDALRAAETRKDDVP